MTLRREVVTIGHKREIIVAADTDTSKVHLLIKYKIGQPDEGYVGVVITNNQTKRLIKRLNKALDGTLKEFECVTE